MDIGQSGRKIICGVKKIAIEIFGKDENVPPKFVMAKKCLIRIPSAFAPLLKIVKRKRLRMKNVFCKLVAHVTIQKSMIWLSSNMKMNVYQPNMRWRLYQTSI